MKIPLWIIAILTTLFLACDDVVDTRTVVDFVINEPIDSPHITLDLTSIDETKYSVKILNGVPFIYSKSIDPPSIDLSDSTIQPPPADLQEWLWEIDSEQRRIWLATIQTKYDIPRTTGIDYERAYETIERSKRHRAYWRKYTHAQGIPIFGSKNLPDETLYLARDIVLKVTSKRPEIREKLRPDRILDTYLNPGILGVYAHNKKYLVVLADGETLENIPLSEWIEGQYDTRSYRDGVCPHTRMCVAPSHSEMQSFVHQAAYFIYYGILYIDRDFEEKVKKAREEWFVIDFVQRAQGAKGLKYRWSKYEYGGHLFNPQAYWAEAVRIWYFPSEGGFTSREEFIELFPATTQLLSEWVSDGELPIVLQ